MYPDEITLHESCDGSILKLTWPAYQPVTNTQHGSSCVQWTVIGDDLIFPSDFHEKVSMAISHSLPFHVYILLERGTYDTPPNGCLSISRALYTRPLSLPRTVVRYYRNYVEDGYQRDYPWVCYHCLEKENKKKERENEAKSEVKKIGFLSRGKEIFFCYYIRLKLIERCLVELFIRKFFYRDI